MDPSGGATAGQFGSQGPGCAGGGGGAGRGVAPGPPAIGSGVELTPGLFPPPPPPQAVRVASATVDMRVYTGRIAVDWVKAFVAFTACDVVL